MISFVSLMRFQRVAFILFAAGICYLAFASRALGCSYISNPDPPMGYIVSRTAIIFVGTVTRETFRENESAGTKYKIHSLYFHVDQDLKGTKKGTFLIEYWEKLTRLTSCDVQPPNPRVGEQWVIFDKYDEGNNSFLNVRDPAFLSWKLDIGEMESVSRLAQIKEAIISPPNSFYGEVEMALFDVPPPDDRRITAELLSPDGTKIVRTVDVKQGMFRFLDIIPGKYVVRIHSARQETFVSFERRITMEKENDGKSYFADFDVYLSRERPEYEDFVLDAH